MINSVFGLIVLITPFAGNFSVYEEFPLPPEVWVSSEQYSTYRGYLTIRPDGTRLAFIDQEALEVRSYDLVKGVSGQVAPHTDVADYQWGPTKREGDTIYFTGTVSDIARQGRRPDEVNTPIAIKYDRSGRLFVSDLGNRRVSVFSPEGSFESSFLLPQSVSAPSDMRITANGNYLLSNLSLDSSRGNNAGYHCNLFSPDGRLLKSFAYTPKTAFDRNLWLGVYALFDLDERGDIYVAFTVDPALYVFNSAGELQKTFGEIAGWWIPPPKLETPRSRIRSEPDGFHGSWTRVVKLIYAGDGRLIRCTETNGLIKDCSKPFILDVFSTDGRLIAGGIESEYLPVGVDNDNMIYFLTVSGDHLVKSAWIESEGK